MLIKVLGAVMIMTSGVLIGVSLKQRLSNHVERLKSIKEFLLYVKRKLSYDMPGLSDMFSEYEGDTAGGMIESIACLLEQGNSIVESVRNGVELSDVTDILFTGERNYIENVFIQLGSSDRESQIIMIDNAVDRIEGMIEEAILEDEKKSKIVMSISVYSGAVLAIILL